MDVAPQIVVKGGKLPKVIWTLGCPKVPKVQKFHFFGHILIPLVQPLIKMPINLVIVASKGLLMGHVCFIVNSLVREN